MLAVIPVRSGELPAGGLETIGEAGGRALLVGERVAEAAESASGHLTECWLAELGGFAPAAWAEALADALAEEPKVVLPACPDGRDLAPRLAHRLGRVLLAGATEVADRVRLARRGGLAIEELAGPASFVATLIPGVRGVEPGISSTIDPTWVDMKGGVPAAQDAETVEVLPPDVTTMDLAEAPRIVGGGAGLDGASRFTQLSSIAAVLGASTGATRVVTDRGWIGHERQIGTTGVVVDPRLYLAFAISGAVQHTSGLGRPDHIISVNTDPHCPMMQLADLAIVADANEVLDALATELGLTSKGPR